MDNQAFLDKYNTVDDVLSTGDMLLYNATDWDLAVKTLHAAVIQRVMTEPDFEVWVPLRYWQYAKSKDRTSALYIEVFDVYVSNKGRIFNLNGDDGSEPHYGTEDDNGYKVFSVNLDGQSKSLMVERAVACCFLPVPDDLAGNKIIDLQVGHRDDDRSNNDVSNLEWKLVKDI